MLLVRLKTRFSGQAQAGRTWGCEPGPGSNGLTAPAAGKLESGVPGGTSRGRASGGGPTLPGPDERQTMDELSTDDVKALNRQEQIWAGMYGPARATAMLDEVRAARAADAEAPIAALIRAVDDPDDIDAEEAGTYRPAVG